MKRSTSERYIPASGRPRANLEGGGSPSRWRMYKKTKENQPLNYLTRKEINFVEATAIANESCDCVYRLKSCRSGTLM